MARPPTYDEVVAALTGQWTILLAAAIDPAAASALPGWDADRVLGHLTANAAYLVELVSAPCPGGVTLSAVSYYAVDAPQGPAPDPATATELAETVAAATETLRDTPGERAVATWAGGMRLADVARCQVLEAVVHGLDLGVAPDRNALRMTVRLLTAVLAARVPGRSVEVRVPPYDAVQVLAGPRHTRGTPPGVVEADPVPFVLVATGRLAWAEAVADGRVRASGERTDLTPYLPLLT